MSDYYLEQFLNYLSFQKKYSAHSTVSYQTDLQQFSQYLHHEFEISSLASAKKPQVRSYVAYLSSKKSAPASIRRKISALRSFYNFLMMESVVQVNPAARLALPKLAKKLPVIVQQSEIHQVLDNQQKDAEDFNIILTDTLIALIYHTGIRLSECITLKQTDIDFSRKVLKVLGKRNKERMIPFNSELEEIIARFIRIKKSKQFNNVNLFCTNKGANLYPEFVYRRVREVLANNTKASKNSPHILRHSIATHLLQKGADLNAVKELLGHASLTATQVYTHNNIEDLIATYRQAHPKS